MNDEDPTRRRLANLDWLGRQLKQTGELHTFDIDEVNRPSGSRVPNIPFDPPFSLPPSFPDSEWLRELLKPKKKTDKQPDSLHTAEIDESVSSAAFVVSWHDPARPVTLTLTSPSLRVITPSTASVQTIDGSSYLIYRIENPEPGTWQLRIKARGNRQSPLPHGYTWGVHGTTPIGLQVSQPKDPVGRKSHQVFAKLVYPDRLVSQVKLRGTVATPVVPLDELAERFHNELAELPLPPTFDKRTDDETRVRLQLFDLLQVSKGLPSIFSRSEDNVSFTGRGEKEAEIFTQVGAVSSFTVEATGNSAGGHTVTRAARLDIRT